MPGVLLHQTPRQSSDQFGPCKLDERHHKVRDSQGNAALETALCQHLIDEAARLTAERHQQMLRLRESRGCRSSGEGVSLAHGQHEFLVVEPARLETRRYRRQRQHRDVQLSSFEHLEALVPGVADRAAAGRGHHMDQSDVDVGRPTRDRTE
jgi:hypothetical protein